MNIEERKLVLVVDDEADVRLYLKSALTDAGFLVETAADGAEALQKVYDNTPDLITLDLVMPKHSGAQFFHALQKNKRFSKIPVLIVTGHARDDLGRTDFEELIMSGPGIYLEKPVHPDTLVAAARKLLNLEVQEPASTSVDSLRRELSQAMSGASREALERALDALRSKKG